MIPVKRELLVAGGWAGGRALAELCGSSVNTINRELTVVVSPSSIWGTSLSLHWDFEAEERVEGRKGDQGVFLAKVVEACEKGVDLSFGSLPSAVGC